MSELFCANTIANIEGSKDIPLQDPCWDTTLDVLNFRVIRLENALNIATPPPMSETSWESLVYRIRRLLRSSHIHRFMRDTGPGQWLVVKDEDSQAPALKRMLARLVTTPIDWSQLEDPKQFQVTAAQHLCHVAGKMGFKINHTPESLAQCYMLSVELSLENDGRGGFPQPIIFPPGMKPPGRAGLMAGSGPQTRPGMAKNCCGCCSCNCHSKDSDSESTIIAKKKGPRYRRGRVRRFLTFSWLKRLGCRRSKVIHDWSSASSSSQEIVD